MVLPFEPLALTFHEVNYFVPIPSVQLVSQHLERCQNQIYICLEIDMNRIHLVL